MDHINNLTNEKIDEQIIDLKKQLVHYQIKKSTKQELKPHVIKNIKYKIAKLLTKRSYNLHKTH